MQVVLEKYDLLIFYEENIAFIAFAKSQGFEQSILVRNNEFISDFVNKTKQNKKSSTGHLESGLKNMGDRIKCRVSVSCDLYTTAFTF